MKTALRRVHLCLWLWLLGSTLLSPLALCAKENQIMGEVQFKGKTHVEKTSGVWVDGEYIGYLGELKGSKKVLLLPGEHNVIVRQDGYQDFTEQVLVQPGETKVVPVVMQKATTGPLPRVTATVKIAVNPSRAAVFMDGLFVGHVGEFEGRWHGMLVTPGEHTLRIALPGYQTFETTIKPLANQTVEIKTQLVKSSGPLTEPLVEKEASTVKPSSATRDTAAALAR